MRPLKLFLVLLALVGSLIWQQVAYAQYKIASSVFGNGGGVLTGSTNHIKCTAGQPLVGSMDNTIHHHDAGFWYSCASLISSVEQVPNSIPVEYKLEQNYPNPFNPTTTICFAIPEKSRVTLQVFDALGRQMATLIDDELPPNEYKVVFEARDLPTGMYFYRLQAEHFLRVRKLLLLK